MCARIGDGCRFRRGLRTAKEFPRWLVMLASLALLFANTLNAASDLSGMADAAEMMTGGKFCRRTVWGRIPAVFDYQSHGSYLPNAEFR
jgi:hypothetical protein